MEMKQILEMINSPKKHLKIEGIKAMQAHHEKHKDELKPKPKRTRKVK